MPIVMTEQQRPLPTAPFPAPPPFWKHFTSNNLARLKAIEDTPADPEQPSNTLPIELQYLKPPPPPTSTYTIFGEEHTVSSPSQSTNLLVPSLDPTKPYPKLSSALPPLEDQLFPDVSPTGGPINHAYYLLKITKSLLLNFLELTTILATNPELSFPKLEDIKKLFLNAHHLINIYRPHQARETLILMMEEQLEEGKREIRECERLKDKIEGFLRDVEDRGRSRIEMKAEKRDEGKKVDKTDEDDARRLWQMIHALDDG